MALPSHYWLQEDHTLEGTLGRTVAAQEHLPHLRFSVSRQPSNGVATVYCAGVEVTNVSQCGLPTDTLNWNGRAHFKYVPNKNFYGRDAQPALVIGRHYMTERDSAPVQFNGIV